jgi:hypothetical protein
MVESIALWTIRCSIACYVVAVGLQLRHRSPDRLRKFVWAAGAVLCVIHVVTAMAAFHDFSHVDSMRHTAEVTARVVGLNWGGGVYINYLFTVVWCVDALRQWHGPPDRRTPVWIQVFMAFIVFNATAVFGPRWWKFATAVALLILAMVWHQRRRARRDHDSTERTQS